MPLLANSTLPLQKEKTNRMSFGEKIAGRKKPQPPIKNPDIYIGGKKPAPKPYVQTPAEDRDEINNIRKWDNTQGPDSSWTPDNPQINKRKI